MNKIFFYDGSSSYILKPILIILSNFSRKKSCSLSELITVILLSEIRKLSKEKRYELSAKYSIYLNVIQKMRFFLRRLFTIALLKPFLFRYFSTGNINLRCRSYAKGR